MTPPQAATNALKIRQTAKQLPNEINTFRRVIDARWLHKPHLPKASGGLGRPKSQGSEVFFGGGRSLEEQRGALRIRRDLARKFGSFHLFRWFD